MIFDDPNFEKTFPEVRVISKEDAFLALLYRLNKGCEFSTIGDVFGGSPETHSRTFGKYLDASLVFFRGTIKIPSKTQCDKMKKTLSRHGFPNPHAVFIGLFFLFLLFFFDLALYPKGDCIDSGIHTTDHSWYTPKSSCTSKHAVRVIYFLFFYNPQKKKQRAWLLSTVCPASLFTAGVCGFFFTPLKLQKKTARDFHRGIPMATRSTSREIVILTKRWPITCKVKFISFCSNFPYEIVHRVWHVIRSGIAQFEPSLCCNARQEKGTRFRKHVKAFKSERSQIERAFGMILRKWSILAKPFRGRGKRYLRLGQIVLLGCQLTNLVFALEETQKQKSNMVNLDPPKTFSDILDRLM